MICKALGGATVEAMRLDTIAQEGSLVEEAMQN